MERVLMEYTYKFLFGNGTWFRCYIRCNYLSTVEKAADRKLEETFGKYNKDNEIKRRGGIVGTEVKRNVEYSKK